jgi:hypothetical protein
MHGSTLRSSSTPVCFCIVLAIVDPGSCQWALTSGKSAVEGKWRSLQLGTIQVMMKSESELVARYDPT